MSQTYSNGEVAAILGTYRRLVPDVGPQLSEYWDLEREQPWSCLVSDFHHLDASKVTAFHEALQGRPKSDQSIRDLADWLRAKSHSYGVGFSLGISPWTDDLLLRSFSGKTRDVIIVLGHDWYPIVNDAYSPRSPLVRSSITEEANYSRAVPIDRALVSGVGLLFVNLYPHFRGPEVDTTGKMTFSYAPLVRGLEALCAAVSENYRIRGVVSWGGPVWKALQARLDRSLRTGLWRAVQRVHSQEAPLQLPMAGGSIPYYPFLHPSSYLKPRFADPEHLEAYRFAWDALLSKRDS